MSNKFEKTKYKTLAWCNEDWIDLHAILCFVKEFYHYKDLKLKKNTTLEVVKNLLEEKLIIAGDLLPGNTFKSRDISVDKIIEKIKYEWDNLERELGPYEIVCFDITDLGKKELDSLKNVPELREPIYYFRICEGGQKGAEELLNKLAKDAQLIKNDTLRKIKVYKLLDNSQFCYRKHSKFGMLINTIDIQFSDIKKYIQFKFTEKL